MIDEILFILIHFYFASLFNRTSEACWRPAGGHAEFSLIQLVVVWSKSVNSILMQSNHP